MNRKQRQIAAYRMMAERAMSEHLEISTTFVLAAVILAMDRAHCKVNYDKWFRYFAEIYPELLNDPVPHVKEAEKIIDADIEIHWE